MGTPDPVPHDTGSPRASSGRWRTLSTARWRRLTEDEIAFYNEHSDLRLRQVFTPGKIALQLVGRAIGRLEITGHGVRPRIEGVTIDVYGTCGRQAQAPLADE